MLWHIVGWILGIWPTPNGTPASYQFWSGVAPGIAILSVPIQLFRRHNCVVKGCWRFARFQQGPYKVCQKHHPEVPDTEITHEHVLRDYNEMDDKS